MSSNAKDFILRMIKYVLRRCLSERGRARIQGRDLELLNRAADELNREAADVLDCLRS